VTVPSEKLQDFMAFAEFLEIRGLRSESAAHVSPPPSSCSSTRPATTNGSVHRLPALSGNNVKKAAVGGSGVGSAQHTSSSSSNNNNGGSTKLKAGAQAIKRPHPNLGSPIASRSGVDPLAASAAAGPKVKVMREAPPEVLVKAELTEVWVPINFSSSFTSHQR
jgi:hypothetical protein